MSWPFRKSSMHVEPQDLVGEYAARGVQIADLTGRLAVANTQIAALEAELAATHAKPARWDEYTHDLGERVKRLLTEKAKVLGQLDEVTQERNEAKADAWTKAGQIEWQAGILAGLEADVAERDATIDGLGLRNTELERLLERRDFLDDDHAHVRRADGAGDHS